MHQVVTNKVGWLAVQNLRGFTKAVAKWANNNQLQGLIATGRAPLHRRDDFHVKGMLATSSKPCHRLPGNRLIAAELFRRGKLLAICPPPAVGGCPSAGR